MVSVLVGLYRVGTRSSFSFVGTGFANSFPPFCTVRQYLVMFDCWLASGLLIPCVRIWFASCHVALQSVRGHLFGIEA